MYEMSPTEVAYGAFIAQRLIDARVRDDRNSWLQEVVSHDERSNYIQLAIYLICAALRDIPQQPDMTGKSAYCYAVLNGATGEAAEVARDLIDGATLIVDGGVTDFWNNAWDKVNDDVLWTTVGLITRTWQFAVGDDRMLSALLASISSMHKQGWHRRILCSRRHYRWPLRYIRYLYKSFQAAGNPAQLLRSENWASRLIRCCNDLGRSVRIVVWRNRAYDNPIIPDFHSDGMAYTSERHFR